MKVLVIDNYDSFTYNLVYMLRKEELDITVFRNDKIQPDECLKYDAIFISPGPGVPKDAGNLTSIIEVCAGKVPMLGVCLGHQAIAEYLGCSLKNMSKTYHGVEENIKLTKKHTQIFNGIPSSLFVGLYHSWEIDRTTVSQRTEVTALTQGGCIMAIQNVELQLYGIQFHPESILTPDGKRIIRNFIKMHKS